MLSLKPLSCIIVICFGLVQSKCIQNVLLTQVLQSNMNTLEKLKAVNEIVLNGHNAGKDLQIAASSDWPYHTPGSNLGPSNSQFQALPTSFEPWASLGSSKQSSYQGERVQPSLPWDTLASNQQSTGPLRYHLPTWNPLMDARRQFNSYQNQYQPPQNLYNMDLNPSFLNLQNSLYNQDRSNPYGAQHAGMESSWASQLSYPNQYPSPSDSNPSTVQQFDPKNPISSLQYS